MTGEEKRERQEEIRSRRRKEQGKNTYIPTLSSLGMRRTTSTRLSTKGFSLLIFLPMTKYFKLQSHQSKNVQHLFKKII